MHLLQAQTRSSCSASVLSRVVPQTYAASRVSCAKEKSQVNRDEPGKPFPGPSTRTLARPSRPASRACRRSSSQRARRARQPCGRAWSRSTCSSGRWRGGCRGRRRCRSMAGGSAGRRKQEKRRQAHLEDQIHRQSREDVPPHLKHLFRLALPLLPARLALLRLRGC